MTTRSFPGFPVEGLRFLRSLRRHNNREWFVPRKHIYQDTLYLPMTVLIEQLAVEFRKFAPEMTANPKQSIYRIYRDTRFSTDKTPYKTHIAAVFPRQGLGKHEGAGFYMHLAHDELLIAGGLYMCDPKGLILIREHIAANHRKLAGIVGAPRFRKLFGELEGDRTQRMPRGYPEDHPAAQHLRHKQFLAGRKLEPESATTPQLFGLVTETFKEMTPLLRFLNEPLLRYRQTRDRETALLEDS